MFERRQETQRWQFLQSPTKPSSFIPLALVPRAVLKARMKWAWQTLSSLWYGGQWVNVYASGLLLKQISRIRHSKPFLVFLSSSLEHGALHIWALEIRRGIYPLSRASLSVLYIRLSLRLSDKKCLKCLLCCSAVKDACGLGLHPGTFQTLLLTRHLIQQAACRGAEHPATTHPHQPLTLEHAGQFFSQSTTR